jgi:GDP-L-fucose synthase
MRETIVQPRNINATSILITGSGPTGFVGRNLAEVLREKYTVFSPSRKELDLRDFDAVSQFVGKNRIETVIHASSSLENTLDSDLRMYFNLERISRNLRKLIYFGSGAEYDKRYDIVMATEDDIGKRIPLDEYGFAKYIMTQHARKSDNIYCLRLFGIFGKYENWTYKFISNLCCKAVYDLPLTVRKECAFDYIFIDDLPPVVEWMLDEDPPHADFNFVSGRPVLLTQIADMVLAASGKKLDVQILDPKGRNNEYTASCARLKDECPRFAVTPLEQAVEKLYRYYYDNKNAIAVNVLRETR